jgi:hypothetical protein
MATTDNRKEIWVQWTRDAMSRYTPPDGKIDIDELVDDMSEVTTKYADQMLDNFEERFEGRTEPRTRQRKKPEED